MHLILYLHSWLAGTQPWPQRLLMLQGLLWLLVKEKNFWELISRLRRATFFASFHFSLFFSSFSRTHCLDILWMNGGKSLTSVLRGSQEWLTFLNLILLHILVLDMFSLFSPTRRKQSLMQVASKLCLPVAPHVVLYLFGNWLCVLFCFHAKDLSANCDLNKSRREFRCWESLVSAEAGGR